MTGVLNRHIPGATLFQLSAEAAWLFVAAMLALRIDGHVQDPVSHAAAPALAFAVLIVGLNGAFGLYRRDAKIPFRGQVARIFLALAIAVYIVYLLAPALPGGQEFNNTLREAVVLGVAGLIVVRHLIVSPIVRRFLPHRVLVLGTGPEARVVEASLATADPPGLEVVGFYALEKVAGNGGLGQPRDGQGRRARGHGRAGCASTRSSSRCASSAAACCRCARCSNAG